MTKDSATSPVGWYYASYVLRFTELTDGSRNDPERKFLTWENTVLIQAGSLEEAYEKVTKLGRQATKPYRGGEEGVPVRWRFEGITELIPIYEKLQDGAEIAWTDYGLRKLKTVKKWVRSKSAFKKRLVRK